MTTHQQPPAVTRKSVTGFVTKLVGDSATYGFINDEIFFQQMNVVGNDGPAAVNDRVFAECEYSAHLPIKWNATSVKILSKAGAGHSQPIQQQPLQAANLESDPRKQSRQSLLNQQSQSVQPPTSLQSQQFNPQQQQQSANSMAPTYQQHRQQRQQLQTLDVGQSHENELIQAEPMRLLDQAATNPTDLYYAGINNQAPFVTTQPQLEVQPFQDTPMGPPKITFTSQLGSAFVQSPMISTAFLQQPPPVLPQQQHSSGLGQQNNQHNHQRQQQHNNQHNKGARFNNQGDKNDRHTNRRDRNDRSDGRSDRNDSKFNNSNRSNDRDTSFNNRSSRQNDSRDRSANRGQQTKRNDDTGSRPSPPVQSSSMRSTTSVSSERGANKTRRNYEAQNIPKSIILTDLNSWNMKNRCSSSIHVPSDLKYIKVNRHFRLDVKHTPKPLAYRIEPIKSEGTDSLNEDDNPTEEESVKSLVMETSVSEDKAQQRITTTSLSESQESGNSTTTTTRDDEKATPTMSKTDIGKLNHKYCVKVVLLSLPELETIYKKVFGPNLDSYNSDNRSNPRLDEAIELLCNKGANGGHSFIGGKFDPVLDGFVEGQTNEFERHGRQPDLIATCKRVVLEQTGLDLGPCKSWTLVSTFIYNNKSDYFSPKASVEYSFIYLPSVWTLQSDSFDASLMDKPVPAVDEVCNQKDISVTETNDEPSVPVDPTVSEVPQEEQAAQEGESATGHREDIVDTVAQTSSLDPNNLTDLKVVDLKNELDRRDVKYKPNAKKAELVSLLQESLISSKTEQIVDEQDTVAPTTTTISQEETVENKSAYEQLEEGEVASDSPEAEVEEGEPADAISSCVNPEEQEISCGAKRKASDADDNLEQPGDSETKRVCIEAKGEEPMEEDTKTAEGPAKVTLIREPFVVKSREGQQQLTLVSLYDAIQVSRYDQFELSVASSILRESLVQHLSEYIFTALVEDHNRRALAGEAINNLAGSNELANNDSNNNNATKSASCSLVSSKMPPVDRYINLAFAYFDSAHTGHLNADDLSKLFNNTNLTVSKRALVSLLGEGDKFNYRSVPELAHDLSSSTCIYKFPEQFTRLPGFSSDNPSNMDNMEQSGTRMIEFQGVSYDVEKLIQQANDSESLRLNLVDRFNHAIQNHDKQAEEIHLLEVNQQSLSRAIKAQNDEICELKRERDNLKKRVEGLRKGLKGAIGTLSELVKDEAPKKET